MFGYRKFALRIFDPTATCVFDLAIIIVRIHEAVLEENFVVLVLGTCDGAHEQEQGDNYKSHKISFWPVIHPEANLRKDWYWRWFFPLVPQSRSCARRPKAMERQDAGQDGAPFHSLYN